MNSRRIMIVAAVLALAACGPSKEEERVSKLKDMCKAAVGGTVLDLENEYGISIRLAGDQTGPACGTSISTLGCADGPSHCILGFWLPASTDPALCKPTGCYFACDIRAAQDDLKAHEEDHLATVCGTRWVDGQPAPGPFYYSPFWIPGLLP
jgi:hypothetical protein